MRTAQTDKCYLCEMPEGARDFYVGEKTLFYKWGGPNTVGSRYIDALVLLPPNHTYTPLGMFKDIGEEEAGKAVKAPHMGTNGLFYNYEVEDYQYLFAIESLASLVRSKRNEPR